MRIKRMLAFALALVMIFSATAVLAANMDLTVNGEVVRYIDWGTDDIVSNDMVKNSSKYQIEFNNNNYKVDELIKAIKDPVNVGKTPAQVAETLTGTPVTPPTPPADELKVDSIVLNDAQTIFTVNFNRAVLAKEEATLKIEVLQGGNPLLGGPGYKLADDKKSATITFTKALSAGTYTIKVTGIKTEKTEEFEIKAPIVITLSAVDAKTLKVAFEEAVTAADQLKAKFAFKKDTVAFATPAKKTWAADGKSVTFESGAALLAGKYIVTVKDITGYPAEGKPSNEFTLEAQAINKLEITNDVLDMDDDNIIVVKAFDQYSEVTKNPTDFNFYAYNTTKDTDVPISTEGKINQALLATNKGDKIRIIVELKDNDKVRLEKVLEVVKQAIDHVTFGTIVPPNGAKRVFVDATGVTVPISAVGLDGKPYPLKNTKKISDGASNFGLKWTIKGVSSEGVELKDGMLIFKAKSSSGEGKIEVYAPAKGKKAVVTFAVEDNPVVKEFKINFPEKMFPGAEYTATVEGKDQYGAPFNFKKDKLFKDYFDAVPKIIQTGTAGTFGTPITNAVLGTKFTADNTIKITISKGAMPQDYEVQAYEKGSSTKTVMGDEGQTFKLTSNPEITSLLISGIAKAAETDSSKKTAIAIGGTADVSITFLGKDNKAADERELTAAELKRYSNAVTIGVKVDTAGIFAAPYEKVTLVQIPVNDADKLGELAEIVGVTAKNDVTIAYSMSVVTGEVNTPIAGTEDNLRKVSVNPEPTALSVEVGNVSSDNKMPFETEMDLTIKAQVGKGATAVDSTSYNKTTTAIFSFGSSTTTVQRNVKFENGVMTILGEPIKAIWGGKGKLKVETKHRTGVTLIGESKEFSITGSKPVKFNLEYTSGSPCNLKLTAIDKNGNIVETFSGSRAVKVLVGTNKTDKGDGEGKINFIFTKGVSALTAIATTPLADESKITVEYTDPKIGTVKGEHTVKESETKVVAVDIKLTNLTGTAKVTHDPTADFTYQLKAETGYTLPGVTPKAEELAATLVVKVAGDKFEWANAAAPGTYQYTGGLITIPKSQITGKIEIVAAARGARTFKWTKALSQTAQILAADGKTWVDLTSGTGVDTIADEDVNVKVTPSTEGGKIAIKASGLTGATDPTTDNGTLDTTKAFMADSTGALTITIPAKKITGDMTLTTFEGIKVTANLTNLTTTTKDFYPLNDTGTYKFNLTADAGYVVPAVADAPITIEVKKGDTVMPYNSTASASDYKLNGADIEIVATALTAPITITAAGVKNSMKATFTTGATLISVDGTNYVALTTATAFKIPDNKDVYIKFTPAANKAKIVAATFKIGDTLTAVVASDDVEIKDGALGYVVYNGADWKSGTNANVVIIRIPAEKAVGAMEIVLAEEV